MRTASRLPNAQLAVIEEGKITRYLLAGDHPAGRAKAAVFRRFGFSAADWPTLRDALLDHARTGQVISASDSEFGWKYIVEGMLSAIDGRRLRLRAVWFVNSGEMVPRLVTAYPLRGGGR